MGLVGFVRTLFFIIAFYYIFKYIGRLVLPYVIKKGFEKMHQQQDRTGAFRERAKQEEGKVTIKRNTQKQPSGMPSANDGEYVDYEELK